MLRKTAVGLLALFVTFSTPSSSHALVSGETAQFMDSNVPMQKNIVGQVKFEPRYTRIIENSCAGVRCEPSTSSQVYWRIAIVAGENQYVLNSQFNQGNPTLPESIQLGEMIVRPGSTVQIEGNVLPVAHNLFLITDIEKMSLVMDTE
jgi:hypothetical protein